MQKSNEELAKSQEKHTKGLIFWTTIMAIAVVFQAIAVGVRVYFKYIKPTHH